MGVRDRTETALRSGTAVFATEWGTVKCNAATTSEDETQLSLTNNFAEARQWLRFFEDHQISDANWAISDKSEACSALRVGASSTGGWDPQVDLTASGRFIRSSIR